ncbi:hypothetical protein FE257_000263 [Aspergillus nanangensis]|uniref:Telomere-associated protein Rif1 N-terminal domain-containing protein n=1 Tax=Aspergillus nanangensis TaxID=2582783 RepID=A0AAD4CZ60_ASPNN|nr:hypothetical protein FE257_000263 [Aspergillus nanangensis]
MVEVFGPLSARPPTPPRTTPRTLSEKDRLENPSIVAQTPLSANIPNGAPSSRQSKRVNFSPWNKFEASPEPELKVPPPYECKPAKSILKATSSPAAVTSSSLLSHTPESFAMLLESLTQQLAGESLSSRVDAYMQFFGALRTYDNLPAEREIVDKLGLITQFIQRDVSKGFENSEPLQTNLVVQALKLASALLWQNDIAPYIPEDFKVFLVDHSLNSLQDEKVPKTVLSHYMSILSSQNVHARFMTTARQTRLLTLLHDLTNRVTGSAIIAQRLSIYTRILHSNKSLFLSHAPHWMEHLVSGCLHHLKDVRIKAISLGFQISNSFGPNGALSKSIYDIFDRSLDKERKLAAEICERMLRMMGDPDSGVHVPQIWSVMILLLRNKKISVDQWEHFRDFVLVLQRCFNCSDTSIKAQAIIAWNRFVFVASPSETTNTSLLKMLGKPILSQFERKKQEKQGQQPGALVWFSYHNLLYYAFRPSPSFQHLDIVWEEYIVMPSSISNPVPNLSNRIAHVLCNMLWSSQAKVWTANKANETHKLAAEELPALDCRWLRSRITSVLKVFEALFRTSIWMNEIEKSKIALAWVNLSKALSHASSKEVTLSSDSMQAVAHVLGLLQRLWKAGPACLNATENNSMDNFFDRFRFLSTTMIFSLGSIPFTEKLLLKTSDETFQAANTPTHRHLKAGSNLNSPILHLLRLISDVPTVSEPTPAYLRLINDTLQAACNERKTRGSRLELLRQCANLYPDNAEFPAGMYNFSQLLWKSTAQLAADSVCSYPIESARARDGSALCDYQNSVQILSAGLKFPEANQEWNKLLESLVRVVRTEKSDREIATTVVEPLAECMMALRVQDVYLPLSSLLNHSLSITYCQDPRQKDKLDSKNASRHATDRAKTEIPPKLVGLMDKILKKSYEEFNPSENAGVADYIESLTSFMGSGALAFRSAILTGLRRTLALWLQDDLRKVNLESGVESRILTACRALSSAVLNILQSSSSHNLEWLNDQEDLICAGLGSSHMAIAKRFIDFWNTTFSPQHSLPCPESIQRALKGFQSRLTHQKSVQEAPEAGQQGSTVDPSEKTANCGDMLDKSRITFILDPSLDSSHPDAINSSPVIKESTVLPISSQPSNHETQSPEIDDTPDHTTDGDTQMPFQADEHRQRSDVFSMIENLRSSSPPAKNSRLGFMTPPHLRNLRNAGREAGTPQTPTLPAVTNENDDPFLGSSPTPHTRGRAQATASSLPRSLIVAANDPTDPPSSPPEINPSESGTADTKTSQNMQPGSKKSKKNKKKKKKQIKNQAINSELYDSPSGSQRTETPLTKRLRSFTGKTPASSFSPISEKELDALRPNVSSSKSFIRNSTSQTIAPRASKKGGSSKSPPKKSHGFFGVDQNTGRPDFGLDDCIADSFSDDMETQIASQLEQDLEFAVDSSGRQGFTQPADTQSQPPMTRNRKRKRDTEQFATPTNKERRRSSRFSFTKDNAADADAETPKSTHTTRSKTQSTLNTTEPKASSPAESTRNKRRRRDRDDLDDVEATPVREEPLTKEVATDSQNLEAPSSQSRRSSRLSGQTAPVITDELPPFKKPSNNRPRREYSIDDQPSFGLDRPGTVDAEMEDLPTTDAQNSGVLSPEASTETNEPEKAPHSQDSAQQSCKSVGESHPEPQPGHVQADDTQMKDADTEVHPVPVHETEHRAEEITEEGVAAKHVEGQTEAQEQGVERMNEQHQEQSLSRETQTEDVQTGMSADMGMIMSLKKILQDAKSATLDLDSLKQVDDLLFNIRVEAHEALRRNTT